MLQSFTQKYMGITIGEFIKAFNKSNEKKFKDGIRLLQFQVIWDCAKNPNNLLLKDLKNFINEIKEFLDDKRLKYVQDQVEIIEDFLNNQYEKIEDEINRIKNDPDTKLEEIYGKFVINPKVYMEEK